MSTGRKYESIDSAHCLKVQNIVTAIRDNALKKKPDLTLAAVSSVIEEQIQLFEINGQKLSFVGKPTRIGGNRWYVHCPKCGGVCLKLYKPEAGKGREARYLCNKCHDLKSLSSLHGPTRTYHEVIKPLSRLEKIEQELQRHISAKKKAALIDERNAIKKGLESSDYYKIYKYKREMSLKGVEIPR